MATTVIVHLLGADPLIGQVDKVPEPTDTLVVLTNPRSRDGKTPSYITEGVRIIAFPMSRINFVEILAETPMQRDDVLEFYREGR